MKCAALFSLIALVCVTGCNPADPSAQSSRPMTNDGAFSQYVGGLAQAKQNAGKTVDVASLNRAIDQFYVDKSRYPADLSELVTEKYITKVPDAPYGTKIDYDPATGKVQVVNQ